MKETIEKQGHNRLSASVRIWTKEKIKKISAAATAVIIAFRLQSVFGHRRRGGGYLPGCGVIIAFRLQSVFGPTDAPSSSAVITSRHNRLSASVRIWT